MLPIEGGVSRISLAICLCIVFVSLNFVHLLAYSLSAILFSDTLASRAVPHRSAPLRVLLYLFKIKALTESYKPGLNFHGASTFPPPLYPLQQFICVLR